MRTRQKTPTLPTIDLSDLGPELQAILAHRNSLPLNGQSVSDSRRSSTANFCTALRSNSITSEYDMAQLRQSLSECLPTVSESGDSRLSLFAHMAEENARYARQLANMASSLVRAEAQGRLSCPEGSAECDGNDALSGSSVDPPQFSPTPLPPSLVSSGLPSPESHDQRLLSGHSTQAIPPLTCPFASMAKDSASSSSQPNSTFQSLSASASVPPLPENHQNACCMM